MPGRRQPPPFWRTVWLDWGEFLFAYRGLGEGGLLWARGDIVNVVNGIRVIQKMFEALLCASTVLGSKMESKSSCPQGAHRWVSEADRCKVNAKSRRMLWHAGWSGCKGGPSWIVGEEPLTRGGFGKGLSTLRMSYLDEVGWRPLSGSGWPAGKRARDEASEESRAQIPRGPSSAVLQSLDGTLSAPQRHWGVWSKAVSI